MRERTIFISIIGVLVILLFIQDKCNSKREAKLLNEIAEKSGLIKDADGKYAQLITVVGGNSSLLSELKTALDENFSDVKSILKKNDERLLMFSTSLLRFKEKSDTVIIYPMDSTSEAEWRFRLVYPDSIKPILAYEGFILPQLRRIAGQWTSPNPLSITAILTETSKGNWSSRLIAPEYVIVDSIIVRALPPDKIAKQNKFRFVVGIGGGYSFSNQQPVFSMSAGFKLKRMIFLGDGSTSGDLQLKMQREF